MRDSSVPDDRKSIVLRLNPRDWGRLSKVAAGVGLTPTAYVRVAMWRAIRAEEAAAGAAEVPEVWGLIRDTILAAEDQRVREEERDTKGE